MWNRVALASLKPDWRVKAWSGSPPVHRGDQRAGLVVRDNFRHRRSIENAYLAAMRSATREIVLANAYFLPGRRFHRVLIGAAQRGVRVSLLLQGQRVSAAAHTPRAPSTGRCSPRASRSANTAAASCTPRSR